VPVRVHEPRPLRGRGQGARRGFERRQRRAPRTHRLQSGRGRGGHRRALGHDGRAGRGAAKRA
jgi:hypothetical protein